MNDITLYIDCEKCGYENILPETKRTFTCNLCEAPQKISYLIIPYGKFQEDIKLANELIYVNGAINNG